MERIVNSKKFNFHADFYKEFPEIIDLLRMTEFGQFIEVDLEYIHKINDMMSVHMQWKEDKMMPIIVEERVIQESITIGYIVYKKIFELMPFNHMAQSFIGNYIQENYHYFKQAVEMNEDIIKNKLSMELL